MFIRRRHTHTHKVGLLGPCVRFIVYEDIRARKDVVAVVMCAERLSIRTRSLAAKVANYVRVYARRPFENARTYYTYGSAHDVC